MIIFSFVRLSVKTCNFLLYSFPAPTDLDSGAEDEDVLMNVDSQSDVEVEGEPLMEDDWVTLNWPVPNAGAAAGPGPGQVPIDLPHNIAFPLSFSLIINCSFPWTFSIYVGINLKTLQT